MKKLDIHKSFKGNKFKYGGLTTVITIVFLSVLILLNLIVGKLNLSKDLTKNKMFSLSEQTTKILTGLKQDVKIYGFYETGQENLSVTTLLKQYKLSSKNISVEYKDPSKYPQIAEKYSTDDLKVAVGFLVVESGSKYKVIDPQDFVNYNYTDPNNPTAESLAVEQSITSAILNVTNVKSMTIHTLQGHSEEQISSDITKQLELENYKIAPINLAVKDTKLEEGSVLLVVSPKRDLSSEEEKVIRSYLSKGGRALFLMDLIENDLPNFKRVFNSYGIDMQKAITVEGDSKYSAQNPLYLLPKQQGHDILASLNRNDLRVLIPGCESIGILGSKKSSLSVEPLLTTSDNAWGKTNLKTTTSEKEKGDLQGPLNIAVAITDKSSDAKVKDTKIVVVSNSTFTAQTIVSSSNGANLDFLMNSINWVQDKEEGISVRPKSIDDYVLQISDYDRFLFSGIVIILIPGIIVIAGIRMWVKRRQK